MVDSLPPRWRPYGLAVWERRGRITAIVLATAVASIVVSLFLPKWYTGAASVLPPTENGDSFSLMSGMIESSALNRLGLLSTSTPSDVYGEILRSRTIREAIVQKFGLQQSYRSRNLDLALKEFKHHYGVEVNKAGILEVTVEDRDPQRAADMANFAVAELDDFNQRTFNARARRTREFLDVRLADVRTRLAVSEAALTTYEKAHKIIATSESDAVEGVSSLVAQKLSLQVRHSYVSSYSEPNSPVLREIAAEMAAVDEQLMKLPGLREQGSRLALDAAIQRKVFTLLTAQYEDARMQEMKNTPTLAILDAARAPQLKTRPNRSIIVLVSTALAAALCVLWASLSLRQSRSSWSARSTQASAPALTEIR